MLFGCKTFSFLIVYIFCRFWYIANKCVAFICFSILIFHSCSCFFIYDEVSAHAQTHTHIRWQQASCGRITDIRFGVSVSRTIHQVSAYMLQTTSNVVYVVPGRSVGRSVGRFCVSASFRFEFGSFCCLLLIHRCVYLVGCCCLCATLYNTDHLYGYCMDCILG